MGKSNILVKIKSHQDWIKKVDTKEDRKIDIEELAAYIKEIGFKADDKFFEEL